MPFELRCKSCETLLCISTQNHIPLDGYYCPDCWFEWGFKDKWEEIREKEIETMVKVITDGAEQYWSDKDD